MLRMAGMGRLKWTDADIENLIAEGTQAARTSADAEAQMREMAGNEPKFSIRKDDPDGKTGNRYSVAKPVQEYAAVEKQYKGTPQWMKAPNGKTTNLAERQWVQVRTPSFKKWAGDWEAVQRRKQLENAPRVEIKVGAFVRTEGESVQETAKKLFKKAVQKDTVVGQITIDERSAKDSLGHGYGQKKLDVLVTLQNDFDNAVYLGSAKNFDGNDLTNHYFAYPVNYDGELNYVFCRAREDKHQNRLYVHEVFLASELNEKGDTLQTGSPSNGRPQHGGIALYKNILQEILNANPDGVTKMWRKKPCCQAVSIEVESV